MWMPWRGLAVIVAASAACGSGKPRAPLDASSAVFIKTFAGNVNRNVDILFVIDDSAGMRLAQNKLIRDFSRFVTTLQNLPGGLPNVHIGVVSSDMGAGNPGDIDGCDPAGSKMGILQSAGNIIPPATTPCTTGLPVGATFISSVDGVTNYSGRLEEVFGCIAALGESGCGFAHPFAAALRALGADGSAAPDENQGFLRRDAYLAVVLLTNVDDCSAAPGVPLFDVFSNPNIGSVLGPPTRFRCNEFGHLCTDFTGVIGKPNRNAPNNDVNTMVTYTECHSNDRDGFLLPTNEVASALKRLKADSSQVMVASIQAPTDPYTVIWKTPTVTDMSCGAASCPWPAISHSCTAADGGFGDPGVRTADFVDQFGSQGLLLPICQDSFAPDLDRIAGLIAGAVSGPCIGARVKPDPDNPLKPDCTFTAHVQQNSSYVDKVVPWCGDHPGAPCWTLAPAATATCSGSVVMVSPDPSVTTNWNVTVNCSLCIPGVDDPESCL